MRFALLLRDDYSGAPIADGGQLFLVNGRPARPIRKPEGFYVFLAPPGPVPDAESRWTVQIESPRHFPRTVHISAPQLDPHMPLCTVQMYRRPHTGFSDCAWLEAAAPPGTLAVALYGPDPPLALARFSPDGTGLYLQGYAAANLLWRRLCVGEGQDAELFTLTARRTDGGYGIDHSPAREHPAGTPVYLAACGPAGAGGRCSIPVRPGSGAPLTVRIYDEEAMRWRETSCAAGHS